MNAKKINRLNTSDDVSMAQSEVVIEEVVDEGFEVDSKI